LHFFHALVGGFGAKKPEKEGSGFFGKKFFEKCTKKVMYNNAFVLFYGLFRAFWFFGLKSGAF
jgi:hypothetical protein